MFQSELRSIMHFLFYSITWTRLLGFAFQLLSLLIQEIMVVIFTI